MQYGLNEVIIIGFNYHIKKGRGFNYVLKMAVVDGIWKNRMERKTSVYHSSITFLKFPKRVVYKRY